ncbi:nitrite reductase small subunit NirD [Granulibacter bethesdensis]|uniref:nitrite reductase small subunit NirD n=1 Tax=Granulibacter bethesdensis TaxID=364410 RepID=UPI0003F20531|nr:nitrite reductase small subunit NirD [Granulibacter bethesdensis]AHJ68433.1 Nitrite reductase [NAD(P)H] small subunit [Granulibacter bethesdensis]APH60082.1 Nitrite reductase [NAD(P)H] small subunit [Granulibacter bethesdensis]
MTSPEWIEIGGIEDVPLRGARCVQTPVGKIAIVRTMDNRVFAIGDTCPHRNGPLSEGIVHDHSITCPLHNWVFSLETGQAQGADEGSVPVYKLREQEGRLFLSADVLDMQASKAA